MDNLVPDIVTGSLNGAYPVRIFDDILITGGAAPSIGNHYFGGYLGYNGYETWPQPYVYDVAYALPFYGESLPVGNIEYGPNGSSYTGDTVAGEGVYIPPVSAAFRAALSSETSSDPPTGQALAVSLTVKTALRVSYKRGFPGSEVGNGEYPVTGVLSTGVLQRVRSAPVSMSKQLDADYTGTVTVAPTAAYTDPVLPGSYFHAELYAGPSSGQTSIKLSWFGIPYPGVSVSIWRGTTPGGEVLIHAGGVGGGDKYPTDLPPDTTGNINTLPEENVLGYYIDSASLVAGTTYYYKIQTGDGEFSNEISIDYEPLPPTWANPWTGTLRASDTQATMSNPFGACAFLVDPRVDVIPTISGVRIPCQVSRWAVFTFTDPDTGEKITVRSSGDCPVTMSKQNANVGYFMQLSGGYNTFVDEFGPYYAGDVPYPATAFTYQGIVYIDIRKITIPCATPNFTPSNRYLSLMSAISMPSGGGSPILLAAGALMLTSSKPGVYTALEDGTGFTVTTQVTRTQYPVLVASSPDGGRTFNPGKDVGAKAIDSTPIETGLTSTDTVVSTYKWQTGGGYVLDSTTESPDWLYGWARVTQLLAAMSGRLYVNGSHGNPAESSDHLTDRQWQQARVTDDVTGRSGWRDTTTVNGTVPSGNVVAWPGRATNPVNQGGAGQSHGASEIFAGTSADVQSSSDGGDTWSDLGSGLNPPIATPVLLRGVSYDGANVSVDDYKTTSTALTLADEGTRAFPLAGSDANTFVGVLIDACGFIWLKIMRQNPSSDSLPAKVQTSLRTFDPVADIVIGWYWSGVIVLLVRDQEDRLTIYRSTDNGVTFTATVTTSDAMATWSPAT